MEWWDAVAAQASSPVAFDPKDYQLFSPPVLQPDGLISFDSRANGSLWNFDQSKITSSMSDVLGSVVQAGAKSVVQSSADLINKQASNQTLVGQFFRNFQSTKTGAQVNAGALSTRFMNVFANPMLWLAVAAVAIIVFVVRK